MAVTPMRISPVYRRPGAIAPATAPGTAAATNTALINGQNVRYMGPGSQWSVDMPYLQAELIDKTPHDPLAIWEFGSYKIKVKAGQVRLSDEQATKLVASQLGPDSAIKNGSVQFRDHDQLKVKGTYMLAGFLPIPLSVRAHIATPTDTTVKLTPKSVNVFGLPVLWAAKLFGVSLDKYMPAGGLATAGKDKSVTLDLTKTDMFEGKLTRIAITQGQAVVTMGGAPAPSLQGPRTKGSPNYAEVIARGEVALESAIIRNASVVTVDATPQDPYSFNLWDVEGFARVESGDVILDEARLAKKFGGVGGAFIMKSAKLKGQDLVVEGVYEFFGLPLPLDFKINFSKTPSGQLKLTPHDVRIVGFKGGLDTLMDTMAKVDGLKKDGNGFILDLRSAASVEMPPIRTLRTEPGRIVLQP